MHWLLCFHPSSCCGLNHPNSDSLILGATLACLLPLHFCHYCHHLGGHSSQGTSHLKIFFKNYSDYSGQVPNFPVSYSLLTLQLLRVNFSAFISPCPASVCPAAVSPFPTPSLDLLVDLRVTLPCPCLSVCSRPSVPALPHVGATTNSVTCQAFYWSFFILWQLHNSYLFPSLFSRQSCLLLHWRIGCHQACIRACMLSCFSHVWLCGPMDCSLPGASVGFPRQDYWSRLSSRAP